VLGLPRGHADNVAHGRRQRPQGTVKVNAAVRRVVSPVDVDFDFGVFFQAFSFVFRSC
jgi:hypothetical protein